MIERRDDGVWVRLDADAEDRLNVVLTCFLFPGAVVPRSEMAEAAIQALGHEEDPRVNVPRTVARMPEDGPTLEWLHDAVTAALVRSDRPPIDLFMDIELALQEVRQRVPKLLQSVAAKTEES